jgi:hypothetical protein
MLNSKLTPLLLACCLVASCATVAPTQPSTASPQISSTSEAQPEVSLRFIGETTLPHRLQFQGTTVGGISGIDYDAKRNLYYLISDDRSDINPARYYTASLDVSASELGKPILQSVVVLKKPDGAAFGNRSTDPINVPDPEAIRYRVDTDTLFWTSEGDKKQSVNPFLREMKLDGTFVREIPMLPMFNMQKGELGPRDNATFEGMTLSNDQKTVWVAMEAALFEDGSDPSVTSGGGSIRFTQYDLASAKPLRQIAYVADAIPHRPMPPNGAADNGVPEVLMLDSHRMLVLERSFSAGIGNSLRLYLIDTRDGSDTIGLPALTAGNHRAVKKKLLVNFDSLNLLKLDNTEGMTFGPRLANGNRSLIFVSDDNFSARQITQFLAFEVVEK